jgi:hypothetical protein
MGRYTAEIHTDEVTGTNVLNKCLSAPLVVMNAIPDLDLPFKVVATGRHTQFHNVHIHVCGEAWASVCFKYDGMNRVHRGQEKHVAANERLFL